MNRLIRLLAIIVLSCLPAVAAARSQASVETAGWTLIPVDASMSTASVMRNRPFVLPDHLTPAFEFDRVGTEPIDDTSARQTLAAFLERRNLAPDRIDLALSRFDDPAIVTIIPAPNLRAALLMLSDWDPYQVTIDAILDGRNESGLPYETVDFRSLEFGGAVATLQVAYADNRPRLLISDRYRNEIPQQLIPILVHESMHDGIENSFEEEIIASVLDSLAYAEVLMLDPSAAHTSTELGAFNNVQLFALMNSVGRRGAGYVGIETSFDGDVYIGPGLDAFDADSIRAGIASDPWYAQLPAGGSQGGAVLAALLARFPDGDRLVTPDRFSEEALAHIDQGIGLILTPRKVRALAIDLELSIVAAEDISSEWKLAPTPGDSLDSRPFVPGNPALFDLRSMHPTRSPLDVDFARAALRESLLASGWPSAAVSTAIARFDSPVLIGHIPDPTLRAGLLMLERDGRLRPVLDAALGSSTGAVAPIRIEFRELGSAIPSTWDHAGWNGEPTVWVNALLRGERPELLATAILEALMLASAEPCASSRIVAAAWGATLWADFVAADPWLAESATWGTITRNIDLLAVLNSQPFDPGIPAATSIGLRLPAGNDDDVLPGLRRDVASFADLVRTSPRNPALQTASTCAISSEAADTLIRSGVVTARTDSQLRMDDDLLAMIDQRFDLILPAEQAIAAAVALDLRFSSG